MIKTRLVGLLSHAKKYIVYTILWQWLALLSQVIAVFSIAGLLEKVIYGSVTSESVKRTVLTLILVVVIRFFCERMGARSSYLACVDVKRILREKIYEKMLKLGASYREQVSSSEVVQVSTDRRCFRCPELQGQLPDRRNQKRNISFWQSPGTAFPGSCWYRILCP